MPWEYQNTWLSSNFRKHVKVLNVLCHRKAVAHGLFKWIYTPTWNYIFHCPDSQGPTVSADQDWAAYERNLKACFSWCFPVYVSALEECMSPLIPFTDLLIKFVWKSQCSLDLESSQKLFEAPSKYTLDACGAVFSGSSFREYKTMFTKIFKSKPHCRVLL